MVSPVLFVGGEDIDFDTPGGSYASSLTTGAWTPDTTAARFKSGYARQALTLQSGTNASNTYLRTKPAFSSSLFWTAGRAFPVVLVGSRASGTFTFMRWLDASKVVRLRLRFVGTQGPEGVMTVETGNVAGSFVSLGTTSSGIGAVSTSNRIDVKINYSAAGSIDIYANGTSIFSYSGDITTDGATALAYVDYGQMLIAASNQVGSAWSEMIVSTQDTRPMRVVTMAPAALGNTAAWSGAASDVNETFTDDTTVVYTATATAVEQFTVSALPGGVLNVVAVNVSARVVGGQTGPTNMQLGLRVNVTDYWEANHSVGFAFEKLADSWELSPDTGLAWTIGELGTGFNIGLKAIA